MEIPSQKRLNTVESQQEFIAKVDEMLDKMIPHLRSVIKPSYIPEWDPIKEYFIFFLEALASILTQMRKLDSENRVVEIRECTANLGTLEDDIFRHLKIMSTDFRTNGEVKIADEIDGFLEKDLMDLRFLNCQAGTLLLQNLNDFVFKKCAQDFMEIKSPRLLYQHLMIHAKKVEAFVLLFFKSLLTSYFDLFSGSAYVRSDWEKMEEHRSIYVLFYFCFLF